MTATAVPRGTRSPAPRPVASLDDILLALVDVDDNVRDDVGDLTELQASIAELGLLSPVKVTAQADGRYRLVYGQRRVLACRALGRLRISAIVEPAPDVDQVGARRSIEQLAENLQRKDLNPIEEAVALREVLDADPGLTQEALADQLAMSRPWVSNTLRLLKADQIVQDAVRSGKVSASHAKSLVVLPAGEQQSLVRRVVANGLSAHELERELGWKLDVVKQREATDARTKKAIPKAIVALEAAGVDKTTVVYVQQTYNLNHGRIEGAIKKAGWPTTNEYVRERGDASRCDCAVVRLEFSRTWKISPACNNDRHRDHQANNDHVVEQARRDLIARKVDALDRNLLCLIAAAHRLEFAELLAFEGDPAETRALAAKRLSDSADSTYAWGEQRGPADAALDRVLEAFGVVVEAPAPKGRKAAVG